VSFWQGLAATYGTNAVLLQSSYPLSTTTFSNKTNGIVVVVLDGDGNFRDARTIPKANKKNKDSAVTILLPVTEKSMGRTNSKELGKAHPLFDQFEYVKGSGAKFDDYIAGLGAFAESPHATKSVKAIYAYMKNGTLERDVRAKGLAPKDKTYVLFEVETPEDPQSKVYEDGRVFAAWHDYYLALKAKTETENVTIDYISGDRQVLASSHPKKISNASANAKLISGNDDENYTYRGKFHTPEEALAVGYESSQRAHQMLRYLIADRGIWCGGQVIDAYEIGSRAAVPSGLDDSKSALDKLYPSAAQTESDRETLLSAETGNDYASALREALLHGKLGDALSRHENIAVFALDAATEGRLSVTFYRELPRGDYLERVADWHDGCKWRLVRFEDKRRHEYIGCPSGDSIIEAVYGKPRGGGDENYKKIKKQARQKLLHCVFDNERIPKDYVNAAVRRCSAPDLITRDGKFDASGFARILATTCALVRKFKLGDPNKKEEYNLSLDHDCAKRDYLYGRLLGAADKLESYDNYKSDHDRTTNAIHYMSAFSQHPFRTWKIIYDRLNPSIQSLRGNGSVALSEIERIQNSFTSLEEYCDDTPLDGTYLLGYFCERQEIDRLVRELKNKKGGNDE
jgi:CRISPR-associated protein Csd1